MKKELAVKVITALKEHYGEQDAVAFLQHFMSLRATRAEISREPAKDDVPILETGTNLDLPGRPLISRMHKLPCGVEVDLDDGWVVDFELEGENEITKRPVGVKDTDLVFVVFENGEDTSKSSDPTEAKDWNWTKAEAYKVIRWN